MDGLFRTGWGGQVNVLNAVVQMCIDPWTIEAVAVEEDLGEAKVDCAKGGEIVQIVPLQGKTRRFHLKEEASSSREELAATEKRLSELETQS
jgi:hypothetical protein